MVDRNPNYSRTSDFAGEARLIDAAWVQFEQITAGRQLEKPPSERFLAIPGYRILGEVHRGGQGVVYQAIQESTHRKIAIKILKQGPFADRIELARFEREIDVLSRLNDPHIVAIHDRGLTDGHAYYVMDYIAGMALDAYVTSAELGIAEILALFAKICDAVNVAHLRGVIHRDLKPGNIRIDLEGKPRILDFGLAKLEEEVGGGSSAYGMTMTGQFVGSLPWASPEQAEGQSESLDIRTDVYSLGVVLYQLLTNCFPYPVTGRVIDVIRHITQSNPERLTSTHRQINSELELIVMKCLAKEPAQRYQSAGELARDIRLYLADEPILATVPSAAYRLRKFVHRNRGAVIAGTVAVIVLLIATGVSIAFGLSAVRHRAATESALVRAQKAEGDAKARAADLERVAKFQEAQLSGINATTMGARLRAGLLKKAREAARQLKLPPDELTAQGEKLEKLVAGSDFTGLALDALDDNFFQPALTTIERDFAGQPIVQARLLQSLASTLLELGLRDAARAPQEKALEIRRRELGAEHLDTLVSANRMGELLRCQGKLIDAEPYIRETLETCTRVLGIDHPDTLEATHNMGLLLQAQGKLGEAEPFLRSAAEKRRLILGEEHLDTLVSISDLGMLLQARGKLPEAEGILRESLEKSRRVLGENHHNTMNALNQMGVQLQEQGKLGEAEALYREALEKNRRLLGDDHPDTITSIENMAYLYQGQGKPSEAEPYQREALEKTRRVLGDEHPDTLTAINNMAMMLKTQGKLSEAEPYYHEALDKRRRVLGDDHPHTILSIENLGMFLIAEGKLSEAEPYCREALERRRRTLGDDHPDTAISINNMGFLLRAEGKMAEAEPLQREAFERSRRALGAEHPNTLILMVNLGANLQSVNKYNEAIELLAPEEAAARRAFTGGNIVRLGRFLAALGRARAATGAFESAKANLDESYSIFGDAKGVPVRDRTAVIDSMVVLYDAWESSQPGKGYGAIAAQWREKSNALKSSSQPAPGK